MEQNARGKVRSSLTALPDCAVATKPVGAGTAAAEKRAEERQDVVAEHAEVVRARRTRGARAQSRIGGMWLLVPVGSSFKNQRLISKY